MTIISYKNNHNNNTFHENETEAGSQPSPESVARLSRATSLPTANHGCGVPTDGYAREAPVRVSAPWFARVRVRRVRRPRHHSVGFRHGSAEQPRLLIYCSHYHAPRSTRWSSFVVSYIVF